MSFYVPVHSAHTKDWSSALDSMRAVRMKNSDALRRENTNADALCSLRLNRIHCSVHLAPLAGRGRNSSNARTSGEGLSASAVCGESPSPHPLRASCARLDPASGARERASRRPSRKCERARQAPADSRRNGVLFARTGFPSTAKGFKVRP
jgi:hypothetical protein